MTAEPALQGISVLGVGRTFDGGVRALDNVALDVPAGALVTLVGPSGCGKTTLLRIMGGLDAPSEGRVEYRGSAAGGGAQAPMTAATAAPTMEPALARVAFAFQEARLLPWRSVARNIALPLELRGMDRAERNDRAMRIATQVGLGDALRRLPAQLSGGMRMRAAIARALVTEPRVLLLDEPFGALDEITRHALDDLLLALWRTLGMTVVMVTHSITEAVYLGQQVIVLAPGPGRVVHTLRPPFSERTPALRTTPEFAAAAAEVLRELARGVDAGSRGSAP